MADLHLRQFQRFDSLEDLTSDLLEDLRALSIGDLASPNAAFGGGVEIQYLDASFGTQLRRIIWGIVPKGTADKTVFVVDDSVDYRDRMLWTNRPLPLAALDTVVYPGSPRALEINDVFGLLNAGIELLYYTRDGYAEPTFPASNNYMQLTSDIAMYARDTDGALVVASNEAGADVLTTFIVMMTASMQLGARLDPADLQPAIPPLYSSAGDLLSPADLNNQQDAVHMDQVKGSEMVPLGRYCDGDPPLSRVWNIRGADVRQPLMTPYLERFFALNSTFSGSPQLIVLDDTMDWRDRIVWLDGTQSADDIRPGEANEADSGNNVASTTTATAIGYTGSGSDGAASPIKFEFTGSSFITHGSVYADEDTGALMWISRTAARYFVMRVRATPQLGPRSLGQSRDGARNNPEDALGPATRPGGSIDDDATAALTGIVGRYRADLGVALVDGALAAWADQSGADNHLVQIAPGNRGGAPARDATLNDAHSIPFDGSAFLDSARPFDEFPNGFHLVLIGWMDAGGSEGAIMAETVGALAADGRYMVEISAADSSASHEPNAAATPSVGNVAAPNGDDVFLMEIAFAPNADKLEPTITWVDSGGDIVSTLSQTSNEDGTSVASLVHRFLPGFVGRIAEIIICDEAQSTSAPIFNSGYVTARYGF